MNPTTNLPLWNVIFGMVRSKKSAPDLKVLSTLFKDKGHKFSIFVIIKNVIGEFEAEYLIYDVVRERITKLDNKVFLAKYAKLDSSYIITNMLEVPESKGTHILFRPNTRIVNSLSNILDLQWNRAQSKQLSVSAA